jgi:DNA polymerase I-like protein with 3'-5' exonuclease and polymerase domains
LTEKGNPKVDEAVLKKLPYEEAKELVHYFGITKLLSQVEDWILRASNSRDGRIHGGVNTQGTVTGRMTASQPNLQQVSGDPKARALFCPQDGWVQVGVDASGLEARLLASRMARWDKGDFAYQVLNEDIHTVNQKAAGLPDRDSAKTFFYALIYGAGDLKIGQIVGSGPKKGKEIKKQYLDSMPALKQLLANVEWQVQRKGTVTLLDGREVPCRAAHKALNVQLQGDGAMLMKLAQILFNRSLKPFKGQVKFMATVHDEWQLECDPLISDIVGTLGCEAIKRAGEILGCKIEMGGEFRVGNNWSECH